MTQPSGERQSWKGRLDFFLSAVGYTIGLGNVWRFPYLCYINGGGAFLIPYLTMLLFCGLPLLQLEFAFGQFASLGPITAWKKISPLFKGVGYAIVFPCFLSSLYYNLVVAWTVYYMYASLSKELPWIGCDNEWNTELCVSFGEVSHANVTNQTAMTSFTTLAPKVFRPSEEYFTRKVLGATGGLHEMGSVRPGLLLCYFISWAVIYICISRGIHSSGKVVYFTATFPFVVLFVLFIRGVTLPGALDGIFYFIKPDFEKLLNLSVWRAAANQVFYSYGVAWGGMLTLASYNDFNTDVLRSGIKVVVTGCITSFFAGFVIFSILGFMAHDAGMEVSDVVESGPGLAFIAYPEAVAMMPLPQLWSFLFFFMLFILGLDTQFVGIESIITAVVDEAGLTKYKHTITFIYCILAFLLGIPFVMEGGVYLMTLLDWYSSGVTPLFIGVFESYVICWVYGIDRFVKDIESMVGYMPWRPLQFCWKFITPNITLLILVLSFVFYSPAVYGDYKFPLWSEVFGWFTGIAPVFVILAFCVYVTSEQRGTNVWERIVMASRPADDWGPAKDGDRVFAGYSPLDSLFIQDVSIINRKEYIAVFEDTANLENMAKDAERQSWTGRFDFFLSALGFFIGLGNVWRFPYLCYINGGGAFLIPYITVVIFAGLPLVQMELSLGQFTSLGIISAWKISPLFKGIGYAVTLICFLCSIYYILIITWTIYYMYWSMSKTLPWIGCENEWNTNLCRRSGSSLNISNVTSHLTTPMTTTLTTKVISPSEEFFENKVLRISDGLHEIGSLNLELLLCLAIAWVLVYLCIIRGVNSSGKVVYFTATFPFVLLTVLFVRGVTLPGAIDGIMYFIKPNFSKVLDLTVWRAAANQVFYSFAAAWGGMLTLASYNDFNKDFMKSVPFIYNLSQVEKLVLITWFFLFRTGVCIVACGCFTSLFSGFVIFSVLGFMAQDAGVEVGEVVSSGPGLAFIVYPEAIALMPFPQVWAFLFFFMLFILGLDSQFVTFETFITAIVDEVDYHYPGFIKHKNKFTFLSCLTGFILGIPFVTDGGVYLMTLFDWYSAGVTPMFLGVFECYVIGYVYGINNFSKDVASMVGHKPSLFLRICWKVITPTFTMFILIMSFVFYAPAVYGDYTFPLWAEVLGWFLAFVSVALIPIVGLIIASKQKGNSLCERILMASRPAYDWGPAKDEDRIRAGYRPFDSKYFTELTSTIKDLRYLNKKTDNSVV
ncbi:uncharacterized protein [Antedon mediterranea]|uniref:uncharacterized protein n=1 Tax=Antedon mediterranea TaxID=105859 RepID=UPI003AF4F4EB